MTIALHVSLLICAVLLLHTWCQGTTLHRCPFKIIGNNVCTEGLPYFHTEKVQTQPPTPTNPFPSDTPLVQLTYKAGKEQLLLYLCPPSPGLLPCLSNPTRSPFLHFDARIICPYEGESTRPPGSREQTGVVRLRKWWLPKDVNSHFQGTAFLKGWWFSEDRGNV